MTKEMKRKLLDATQEQYPDVNITAIFGGMYFVKNINDIVNSLPHIVKSAKFFGWQQSIVSACNTFCHLCMVDPMLVEAYIGKRFEEIFQGE